MTSLAGSPFCGPATEAEQWAAALESPFAPQPYAEAEQPWTDEERLAWADDEQPREETFGAPSALVGSPGSGISIAAGFHSVESHPLLAKHRGRNKPDLILKWNAMASPTKIDVVVHLHGYSSCPPERPPRVLGLATNVLKISGLDFTDPDNPSAPGRVEPTLAVLPRGSYAGDLPGRTNRRAYDFPALVRPGALTGLLNDALRRFSDITGIHAPLGRLIVSAHSGGGAALMAILRHSDPEEIHVFDALYGNPDNLISWARRHIRRDIAGSPGSSGAMRVLYDHTRKGSEKVWNALCESLRNADPDIRRRYRVEATPGHCAIPRRYGWLLLRDAGADLPRTTPLGCGGNRGRPSSRTRAPSPGPTKEVEGQRSSGCAGCRGALGLELVEDHQTDGFFDEGELAEAREHERYQYEGVLEADWHENASVEEPEDLHGLDQAGDLEELGEYEDGEYEADEYEAQYQAHEYETDEYESEYQAHQYEAEYETDEYESEYQADEYEGADEYEEAQGLEEFEGSTRRRPPILTSQALRDAWRQYRCTERRMVPLRLFGWNTPVNPETVAAWRALEQALTAAGYRPHRAWVFVCRNISNSSAASLHAYGLAIDIDHRAPVCNVNRRTTREVRFSQGATKAERCADVRRNIADTSFTPNQVTAVLAIRTTSGHQVFAWGGHWRSTKDTMHFQINVTPQQLATGIQPASVMQGQRFHQDEFEDEYEYQGEYADEYEYQGEYEDEYEEELAFLSPEGLDYLDEREEDFAELHDEEWEDETIPRAQWLGETRSGPCSGQPAAVPPGNPVPFAPPPGHGSYWPLGASSRAGRLVSFLAADGTPCPSAAYQLRRFLWRRPGDRLHLGVDLAAKAGDPVVACEDGKIVAFYEFCCGKKKTSWALLVEHANVVINYGEVSPQLPSGLAKGSIVRAGQMIARVGRNPGGSSMLHFETYRLGTKKNERWVKGEPRPPGVLNPTPYLLSLRDHGLSGPAGSTAPAPPAAKPPVRPAPAGTTAGRVWPRVVARIDRWGEVIDRLATARGLNPSIVKAIIAAESAGKPDTGSQNPGGYKGLMQAAKDEAQLIPEVSIRTGIDHFLKKRATVSSVLRSVGLDLAALDEDTQLRYLMTAYNAGEGTLKVALDYAKAANALDAWERPEFFKRALFFKGAYNPSASLAWCLKRLPPEAGASAIGALTGVSPDRLLREYHARGGWEVTKLRRDHGRTIHQRLEGERKGLRFDRSLTLERALARASPLLGCAAEFKHVHRPSYVKRVLDYKRYYDDRR